MTEKFEPCSTVYVVLPLTGIKFEALVVEDHYKHDARHDMITVKLLALLENRNNKDIPSVEDQPIKTMNRKYVRKKEQA